MRNDPDTGARHRPALDTRKALVPFAVALVALPTVALAAALLLSLPGTGGLLAWMPAYRSAPIALFGLAFLPETLAIVGLALSYARRRSGGRLLRAAAALSVAFSIVAAVATVGVAIARRQVPDDLPKLLRLDAAPDRLARIAFSSDAHFGSAGANRDAALSVMRAVNGGPYDAFFVLGDFSEMGFPDDGLFDAARSLATEMTRVPVATAMGNHDALLGGDARYRKLFNERLYYRVDSGTTHVLVANILWDDASLDLSQRAWLEKSLDGIPAGDFVIFASHRFLRSSGYVEPSTGKAWYTDEQLGGEFAAWLAAKGVDLVVSGHNHYMEFLGPDGDNLACAVVGAMGGRRDPPPSWVDPRSAWLNDRDFGFLDVSVFADRATLAFRDPEGKALYETAIAFSPASGKP